MNKVFLQPSFVLHIRPFKETSALIQALSYEYGVVSLIAKGIRRKKSPLKCALQIFNPLLLSWAGKTDLKTLTNVDTIGTFYQLNGKILLSGLYINELIIRLLKPYDAHSKLYDNYQSTIEQLSSVKNREEVESVLRIFEKKLLAEIGYGLDLDKCPTDGRPISADCVYGFEPSIGLYNLENSKRINDTIQISGATLLSLKNEKITDSEQLKEAKLLMRFALRVQLGSKPLNSRKIYC